MFSLLLTALVSVAVGLAAPTEPANAGSLYWMTNDPTGNVLVTAPISANGTIGEISVIPTDGLGQHGDQVGLDPIFSQGPVAVNSISGRVAVVNPQSSTVSVYQLSPTTFPQRIGNPVPTYGDFPNSATFDLDGDVLCVLNIGRNHNVQCYFVDESGLTVSSSVPTEQYNTTSNPPQGPGAVGGTVLFSEDQSHLLVTIKGVQDNLEEFPGFVAAYPLEAHGILRNEPSKVFIAPPAGIAFSLTAIPGEQAYVGSDLATGMNVYDFTNGWDNGTVKELFIPEQGANCWSSYASSTNTYFISDVSTGFVNEITLDEDLTPSLLKQYNVGVFAGADESVVANIGDTQFLYVLLSNETSVAALRLDGPGNASIVQTVEWGNDVRALGHQVDQYNVAGMGLFQPQA